MDTDQQHLSRHERQELKRKEREEQHTLTEKQQQQKKTRKNIVKYGLVIVAVAIFLYLVTKLFSQPTTESYTKDAVHWHAQLDVYACGENKLMPAPEGEHHLGLPLLHTHSDRLIHIEGKIWKKEDIMLGAYMDAIGIPFNDTQLLDYKNDGMCDNGKPNKVRMIVNDKENFEFRNYVINNKDKIELRYE